jgi:hypothetical protein
MYSEAKDWVFLDYGLMINEGVHILHSSIMLIGTLLGIQR